MCDTIPIRTVLATTDDTLYDEETQKWYWETTNEDLYVGIGCGENYPTNFQPLSISPFSWNYCGTQGCSQLTDTLIIVFTFNPESKDHLRYVLDIPSSKIVSRPTNKIKDKEGDILEFDIESATRHGVGSDAILEIWLGRGESRGAFLPEFINKNKVNWVSILEKIGIALGLAVLLVLIIVFIRRLRK